MKKTLLLTTLFVSSTFAFAQSSKYVELDTNSDGRISVEEAASDPSLSAVFADLDLNKDGYLTKEELSEK